MSRRYSHRLSGQRRDEEHSELTRKIQQSSISALFPLSDQRKVQSCQEDLLAASRNNLALQGQVDRCSSSQPVRQQ